MDNTPCRGIMQEYDALLEALVEFKGEMQKLVETLLRRRSIRVHSVTARVKQRESLEAKLQRSPGRYSTLTDVTDVVGVRIITYFVDDVDKVARIIEREFDIDAPRSVDKRITLDPETFGYLSVHYGVRLSAGRRRLTEYDRFSSFLAEVQVRSILQHAWAEIYHDLGYKAKDAIPRDAKRGFARLASLLELGDAEFVRLRDDLAKYARDVARRIAEHPESVGIDQASVTALVRNDALVKRLDREIGRALGGTRGYFCKDFIEGTVAGVQHTGIESVAALQARLASFADHAVEFAREALKEDDEPIWLKGKRPAGLSVMVWALYEAASTGSEEAILGLMSHIMPEDPAGESMVTEARKMLAAYKGIQAEPPGA